MKKWISISWNSTSWSMPFSSMFSFLGSYKSYKTQLFSYCKSRPVFLKPGVATHLCVVKILQCVAKKFEVSQIFLNKPYTVETDSFD